MDLLALPANALHVALQAVGHDLVDLAVVERSPQPAGKPIDAARRIPPERPRDRAERRLDGIDRKAHRSREVGAQQEKLGDPFRPHIGGVALAIRFEPRARSKQRGPRDVRADAAVAHGAVAVSSKCTSSIVAVAAARSIDRPIWM